MSSKEWLACARALLFISIGYATFAAHAEDRDAPISYSARVINPKLTGSLYEPKSRTLLIWGTDGTILYSTDLSTWNYADTPTDADLARVTSDNSGKVLIAVGERGAIIRSDDAGRRWRAVSLAESNFDLRAVIHHAPSDAWIAAGTRGTILRSTDSGKTWSPLPNELNLTLETLFVEPASGALLIGGEAGLIGRSTDAGLSWHLTRVKMQEPVTPVTAIHLLGSELIATSALGRFLISTDRGENWRLLSMGGNAYFTDAVLDPKSHTMLLASHTGDLFRRERGDDSWEKIELTIDGQKRFVSALRYDAGSQSLLAVGHHGLAARSVDGGRQWQSISTGFTTSMESLAQLGDGRFVGFGEGGYLVISADSGKRWRRVSPELSLNLREVAALPGSDTMVASGELGGILRSTDSGRTWESIDVAYP
ncbi:MAG TPA: YCF48-related protein, partial [Steroidobacter sp.]